MILKEIVPPETIEFYYNKQYIPFETEDFAQEFNMNPFVYKTEVESSIKKLVIIWEANLKTKNNKIEILTFKLECGYILDCIKNEESFERLEKLLTISLEFFSEYYKHLNLTHLIRFKNINLYYDNIKHHVQELLPLLCE